MDWYLMVWRRYAEFEGRSRRTEFWMFELINILILIGLVVLGFAGTAAREERGGVLFIPLGLYLLAILIPGLAVRVRRLHDTGKTGWLVLLFGVLGLIPIVGFITSIVMIVFLCQDSDPGINEYGPNPKFPEAAGAFAGNAGYGSLGLGVPPPFASVPNLGFCKHCGAKIADASPICAHCGLQV